MNVGEADGKSNMTIAYWQIHLEIEGAQISHSLDQSAYHLTCSQGDEEVMKAGKEGVHGKMGGPIKGLDEAAIC